MVVNTSGYQYSNLADAQDISPNDALNILSRITSGNTNDLIAVAQEVITQKHPNYDNLSKGARGDQVFTLQQLLCNAGYPTDNDGIFGDKTYQTLLRYQKDKNLKETGSTNNQTWSSLLPSNPDWNKIKTSCANVIDTSATNTEVTTSTTTATSDTNTATTLPQDSGMSTMWIIIMVVVGLLITGTLIFILLK